MDQRVIALQNSYDQVAEEYVARIYHELEKKPLDRELLDRFAALMRDAGTVCDIGCGPGHVARYLHERGVNLIGVDLSPRMVEFARQLNSNIRFVQGDMLALDVADAAWAGIVAFFSLIHIPREHVTRALQELKRALKPNGILFLAFHVGQEVRHLDDWWGKQVSVDFIFFECAEMEEYLRAAGFVIEDVIERQPYEGVEAQTQRCYMFARKPGVTIRRAVIEDSAAIARVQVDSYRTAYAAWLPQAYLDHFTYEEQTRDWSNLLMDEDQDILLVAATNDGKLIGYALGRLSGDENTSYQSELVALHVSRAHQHQGIGRRMIAAVAEELRRHGAVSLMLWTGERNARARMLYERLGGQVCNQKQYDIEDTTVTEVAYGWPSIETLLQVLTICE